MPDSNPLDGPGGGHGSHVAGTAAGFGVTTAGATFAGPYTDTLDATTMDIGPGAAPAAELYALKVFGDNGGTTALAPLAMEWAVDPNGDGDPADHLDVVNLSLGSSFRTSSNAEARIFTNAVNAGVAVVISQGNAGDYFFVGGSPGATPSVITVAASSVGYYLASVQVTSPQAIAGSLPAGTAAFGATTWTAVTGDVVATQPVDACAALTNASALQGKVALIARGTCGFSAKAYAAQQAGAVAVLITNSTAGDPPGMAGSATPTPVTIPVRSIMKSDGDALRAQLTASATVSVTMASGTPAHLPALGDTIASFSSRGPTRSGDHLVLKPDVSAPGVNVISTAAGTGSKGTDMSGTSMAAPITTGAVALLRQAHPTWTPAEIKALLMNTAGHDVFTLPTAPRARVAESRVGAGRIDAALALATNVVAYDQLAPERVSVSFQTTDVSAAGNEHRAVQLDNKGTASVTYAVSVVKSIAPPGSDVTASAASVTVGAGATATLDLVLTVDPAHMVRRLDPTVSTTSAQSGGARHWLSETSGYLLLTPQGGGTPLKVPYYGVPTPASAMATSSPLDTSAGSTGIANLTLTGTAVNTRSLATTPGDQGVFSLVTPFELVYGDSADHRSGGPFPAGYDLAQLRNATIRYVGVTSNRPDTTGNWATTKLFFAINTFGQWGTASYNDVEVDIWIRQAGAPAWQWVMYNADLGRASGNPGSDTPVTVVSNLASGAASTQDYLNGLSASPARPWVPALFTDTMVMPVYAATLGLDTAGNKGLEFQVVTYNQVGTEVDRTPVLRYDIGNPGLATTADPSLTAMGATGVQAPLWSDQANASLPVTYNLANARTNGTGGLLLIHHHNALGSRAEKVAVGGLTCGVGNVTCSDPAASMCDTTSGVCVGCLTNADCAKSGAGAYCDTYGTRTCLTPDCRRGAPVCGTHESCSQDYGTCLPNQQLMQVLEVSGNSRCPAGGQAIQTGFDDNRDTTSYVCNGLSATVNAEAPGANCASGGVKVQVGSGSASYVCNGTDGRSATVTPEPAGANCASGGVTVQVGTATPAYVCNGAPGPAGTPGESHGHPGGGRGQLRQRRPQGAGRQRCASVRVQRRDGRDGLGWHARRERHGDAGGSRGELRRRGRQDPGWQRDTRVRVQRGDRGDRYGGRERHGDA